jgi:hypothetical protein
MKLVAVRKEQLDAATRWFGPVALAAGEQMSGLEEAREGWIIVRR